MDQQIDAAGTITVKGNPVQHDFFVLGNDDPKQQRIVELQIGSKPNQVQLLFGSTSKIEFGSNDGDFMELFLPISMLNDVLYVLEHWKTTYFSVSYKADTKEITNFILNSVGK